jgi:hypothetical protein
MLNTAGMFYRDLSDPVVLAVIGEGSNSTEESFVELYQAAK